MRFLRILGLIIPGLLVALSTEAQQRDPDAMLERALQLADVYNWIDAAPLFSEAERLFLERNDAAKALHARLGRIRSTMEELSLPETSAVLEAELENNPLLQTDKRLRLFCLIVKGDIDGELDALPARRTWEAAQQLARELGDAKWQNRATGELGFIAFLEGDIATAQKLTATALLTATETKDLGAQIRYLSAIGTGLAITGLAEQGLGYLERAANIADRTPDSGYQFLIVTGKVIALRRLGRLDEAESLVNEVIKQAQANRRNVKEAQMQISAAGISAARNNVSGAVEHLQRAVALAKDGRFVRLLADAQFELSALYRTNGDLKQAEELAAAAVSDSQSGGEIYELPRRLQYLGELQAALGKYTQADEAFTRAADIVDVMVGSVSQASTKGALIAAMSQVFTSHFSLIAAQLKDINKAYDVLERARGRATTDLLRSSQSPKSRDVEIEKQIARLRLEVVKATSPAAARRLRDQIFLAEQSRWTLSAADLRMTPSSPIPMNQVREHLGQDELLLSYVLSDPQSFCLVITRNGSRIVPLPARERIEGAVSAYREAIRSKRSDKMLGRDLYEKLLAPVTEIRNKSRLVIVRDGELHLLPFDALVDSAGRYIAETHTVGYAASATAWQLLKTRPRNRVVDQRLLAVGGVPYDENVTRMASTRGFGPDGFGNLPGSRDEVLAAAEALPARDNTLLLGPGATEYAFKQTNLERHTLIHLAVHGVANKDDPDQAALILLSDAGQDEDGIMQVSEILHLRTNADLVVLSACDTATGRIQGAEGIANLTRAFLLAGARNVVGTLWAIDDTFSLNLMKQFYRHLASRKSVAVALTEAKRDMLRTFGARAVPYYWAGFTLEGPGESVIVTSAKREAGR